MPPQIIIQERVHYLSTEYEVLVEAEDDDSELLGIIQMIEEVIIEAVDWDYNEDEAPFDALRERVNYLINEYEAAVSEDEDDEYE